MIIIENTVTWNELSQKVDLKQGFVKAVVDLKQNLLGVEAENHSDIADYFKENNQSDDLDLWGLRIHLDGSIEYNSLINRENNYAHGFEIKNYGILDPDTQKRVTELVTSKISGTFELK